MFSRCRRRKRNLVRPINEYVNELKDLDHLLEQMLIRVQADIKKVSKNGNITKSKLKRRLLLKRHYKNIDDRRTQVLARILQLENLHLNSLQVNSLKNVVAAHSHININPDDVESLIDKLSTFTDDFEEISNRLNEDIAFNLDITDEELEKEINGGLDTDIVFPEISDVSKFFNRPKSVHGSMDSEIKREGTTTVNA